MTRTWRLTFPGGEPFDCEALFVHGGKGYLIPKRLTAAAGRALPLRPR